MVGLFILVAAALSLRLPPVAVSAVATGVLVVALSWNHAGIFTARRPRAH